MAAQENGRGRLKIFFGYSAGVGKTYAMLRAAHEAKDLGTDVVLGYFEPHARPDTIRLTEGLETLPKMKIEYRGIELSEFDVDAAIARRPEILLVDELAHTNAEGSKNRKRYLDVEELLNNGIDVWTTVNVQHLEGMHDLVGEATEVDVSERIPDEIFDHADEVALVDVEPAALALRMREGKIYSKQGAALALENFFRPENLSTLRELLMRRSADRLEKLANNGAWKTKILVLISPSPSSQKNIRVAARMSLAYHCRFSAMYVETQGALTAAAAADLKKHMNLVRDLGGELLVKYGEDVVETVADYVRIAGVTNLIIGKTWQSAGGKAGLEDRFIATLPQVEVLIVPDSNNGFSFQRKRPSRLLSFFRNRSKLRENLRLANKTINVLHTLVGALSDSEAGESEAVLIGGVLAAAFGRSCEILTDEEISVTAYGEEDVSFFDGTNEQAVAQWCRTNHKAAGRGTDTLRNVGAIYFPIVSGEICRAVVAFSCRDGKLSVSDKLFLYKLLPHLAYYFEKGLPD